MGQHLAKSFVYSEFLSAMNAPWVAPARGILYLRSLRAPLPLSNPPRWVLTPTGNQTPRCPILSIPNAIYLSSQCYHYLAGKLKSQPPLHPL